MAGAAQVATASRVQQHVWTAAQSHAHSRRAEAAQDKGEMRLLFGWQESVRQRGP